MPKHGSKRPLAASLLRPAVSPTQQQQQQPAAGASGIEIKEGPKSKAPRLAEERVAALPTGANLVECDGKACTHEVVWPPGSEGSLLPPTPFSGPPARQYPFKIDPFQQTAIHALEAGHSVLVAAHTSAGKTVVAEYAFAMALRDKSRVIYTSPLKALSNQKYRELHEQFGDVGLMTGDVTINENASCLVMTTEILRSMLYRGSEVVREVQLLVYDEIHYLKDKERGVVWEETIILAPKACRFAFLSATIPNAKEFAEWVAKTHNSPCHVVYTDYRPTPLQHYIFPTGGDALYMVVDERGVFREDNFQKALAVVHDLAADGGSKKEKGKGKGAANGAGGGEDSDVLKLVKMIMERNYDPVIVFSFSKRECDKLALGMMGLDLTDATEKELIERIFDNALMCLCPEERQLPQVAKILPLLKLGVGVHHSGFLPIIKEAVEILFSEGLLKVLFATETFSTGLNMPAKTVVFTHARKFDGSDFRWVSSGEYIQMSGRAGRRGLDDRGIVMLMLDSKMDAAVAKDMIKGAPDVMRSEFHLGYNMLLSIMRIHGGEPEQLMSASFRQFQLERSLPQLEAKALLLEAQYNAVEVPEEDKVQQYLDLLERLVHLQSELRTLLSTPRHILPFLQPGRLLRLLPEARARDQALPQLSSVTDEQLLAVGQAFGDKAAGALPALVNGGVWGTVVAFERRGKKDAAAAASGDDCAPAASTSSMPDKKGAASATSYVVDVLVNAEPGAAAAAAAAAAGTGGSEDVTLLPPHIKRGVPRVLSIQLCQIDCLSSVRVHVPQDLRAIDTRKEVLKRTGEVVLRLVDKSGAVPVLDPAGDMKIKDKAVHKTSARLKVLQQLLQEHPLAASPELRANLGVLQGKRVLGEQAKAARQVLKAAQGLILQEDLKHMQRVLRRLNFVDSEGLVLQKGQVAASIQSGHELVLTEMLFNGLFNTMTTEQLLAACSCFVCQEKAPPGFKISQDLVGVHKCVQDCARVVAKTSIECQIQMDEEEFVSSFNATLMDVVAAWSSGLRFADLCKMTKVDEGAIVRSVRRLDELLRQVEEATRQVGEQQLAEQFHVAGQKIKRDVIFAASLYL